jgi:ketosteroid isomerase-like protein
VTTDPSSDLGGPTGGQDAGASPRTDDGAGAGGAGGAAEMEALATRFFAAIDAYDVDALREIYAPDVEVWHNHERAGQDLETNLKVLRWLHRNLRHRRYEEVVRLPTPTGFVEQHVLRATTPSGAELDVPACLVFTVRGGRIHRIEEYIDSAHLAPLG